MNPRRIFSQIFQYGLAFLVIGAITILFIVLREYIDTTLVALLYLIPLGLITAYWGIGPGIASALIAFLTLNYFFIAPYYTLAVHRVADVVILVIFLVVAVVISQLVGWMRAGLAAANDREMEVTQLFELSTALAGLQNDESIAKILTSKIHNVLSADHVEVNIAGPQPIQYKMPEVDSPARPPDLEIPVQSARGVLGEIRLWREALTISGSEQQLLQTFASQGALAFERARLAQAESRARVLEESDRLKSALLSSVSHELRTPLSTIKAAASSLRSNDVKWDSAARPELIAAIDDEADHLNMLVGNLLDMSRIESGVLKPKREWNILSEIIGSVLVRMKHLAENHQIVVNVPENLPLIPVDYVQMEQVFTNLVSNSVKYAPENTTIHITAKVDGDQMHVTLSNQGPQIPQEHLEKIFGKFFRFTAADRVTGTGLGLSICKGIIDAHGGKLWAQNIPDGLAFNFTLPLIWEGVSPPQMPMDTETV
jgi:two-component system sensor histidine kinase KdpD